MLSRQLAAQVYIAYVFLILLYICVLILLDIKDWSLKVLVYGLKVLVYGALSY